MGYPLGCKVFDWHLAKIGRLPRKIYYCTFAWCRRDAPICRYAIAHAHRRANISQQRYKIIPASDRSLQASSFTGSSFNIYIGAFRRKDNLKNNTMS
jgi:hypothetical protein